MKKIYKALDDKYKHKFSNYYVVMSYSFETLAESKRDLINFEELCKLSVDIVVLSEQRQGGYEFLILVIPENSSDLVEVQSAVDRVFDDECLNNSKYIATLQETPESLKIKQMLGED